MKSVELFAGIGGFRLAMDNNNIETVWANDIDPSACKVYRDNFGSDSIIEGDIYKYIDTIPSHDILTGGFPCQPFSKAGKKKGIYDYRGTLFEAIVKIISCKSPKFFILENVNSLLYMNNGINFKTILLSLCDLGYKIEWRVFNASSFGLPQHRLRIIILGSNINQNGSYLSEDIDFNNFNPMQYHTILEDKKWSNISKSCTIFKNWGIAKCDKYITYNLNDVQYTKKRIVKDILQSNVDQKFDFTYDTIRRISSSEYVNKFYNGVQILYNQLGGARMGYSIFGIEGFAPTLTASSSRHYERYKIYNTYRRLTNIEYARIQGFPDNHCKSISCYNQYKLFGNAVPYQIIDFVLKKIINNNINIFNKKNLLNI